jgi:hypothetical protein
VGGLGRPGLICICDLRKPLDDLSLKIDKVPKMSHWSNHAKQWNLICAPLRPSPQDVITMQQGIPTNSHPVLVLGVTPELTEAFPQVVAVDKNPDMLRGLWKSSSNRSTAICADWLTFRPEDQEFAAAVGDGCFTVLGSAAHAERLMEHLNTILGPGKSLRFRLFIRPENTWDKPELNRLMSSTEMPVNFHAFKWMMAMHLASRNNNTVSVREILQFFNTNWPDRVEIAMATGWSPDAIGTIDAYKDSQDVYWFPTIGEFMSIAARYFLSPEIATPQGYNLCEQCPILLANTK